MIRILKDGKVRLSYLPEVLIYMSHGGTSTNSLGAYLAGMKEGHRALRGKTACALPGLRICAGP